MPYNKELSSPKCQMCPRLKKCDIDVFVTQFRFNMLTKQLVLIVYLVGSVRGNETRLSYHKIIEWYDKYQWKLLK